MAYTFSSVTRNSLLTHNAKVDFGKLANSIDSAKGRGQKDKTTEKSGKVRLTKSFAKWTETETVTMISPASEVGLRFANFCDSIAAMEKWHGISWEVTFPECFHDFIAKHLKSDEVPAAKTEEVLA